jgi:hypothetical protein
MGLLANLKQKKIVTCGWRQSAYGDEQLNKSTNQCILITNPRKSFSTQSQILGKKDEQVFIWPLQFILNSSQTMFKHIDASRMIKATTVENTPYS